MFHALRAGGCLGCLRCACRVQRGRAEPGNSSTLVVHDPYPGQVIRSPCKSRRRCIAHYPSRLFMGRMRIELVSGTEHMHPPFFPSGGSTSRNRNRSREGKGRSTASSRKATPCIVSYETGSYPSQPASRRHPVPVSARSIDCPNYM